MSLIYLKGIKNVITIEKKDNRSKNKAIPNYAGLAGDLNPQLTTLPLETAKL